MNNLTIPANFSFPANHPYANVTGKDLATWLNFLDSKDPTIPNSFRFPKGHPFSEVTGEDLSDWLNFQDFLDEVRFTIIQAKEEAERLASMD